MGVGCEVGGGGKINEDYSGDLGREEARAESGSWAWEQGAPGRSPPPWAVSAWDAGTRARRPSLCLSSLPGRTSARRPAAGSRLGEGYPAPGRVPISQ